MKTPHAILIAGLLIAGAIALTSMVDRYQLQAGLTIEDTPAAWRLNVRSGKVTVCMLAPVIKPAGPEPVERHLVQCREP